MKKLLTIILYTQIIFIFIALLSLTFGINHRTDNIPEKTWEEWKSEKREFIQFLEESQKQGTFISPPELTATNYHKLLFLPLGLFKGYSTLGQRYNPLPLFSLGFIELISVLIWWELLAIIVYKVILFSKNYSYKHRKTK